MANKKIVGYEVAYIDYPNANNRHARIIPFYDEGSDCIETFDPNHNYFKEYTVRLMNSDISASGARTCVKSFAEAEQFCKDNNVLASRIHEYPKALPFNSGRDIFPSELGTIAERYLNERCEANGQSKYSKKDSPFGLPYFANDGSVRFMVSYKLPSEGHFPVVLYQADNTELPLQCASVASSVLDSFGVDSVTAGTEPVIPNLPVGYRKVKVPMVSMPFESFEVFVQHKDAIEQSLSETISHAEDIIREYDKIMNERMAENPAKALGRGGAFSSAYPIYFTEPAGPVYGERQCGDYHVETFRISPGIYNELVDAGVFGSEDVSPKYDRNEFTTYDEDGNIFKMAMMLTIVEGKDGSQWVNLCDYVDDEQSDEYTGRIGEGKHFSPEMTKSIVDLMHHFKESDVYLGMNAPTAEDKELVRDAVSAFRAYDGHSTEVSNDVRTVNQAEGIEVSDGASVDVPTVNKTDDHSGLG